MNRIIKFRAWDSKRKVMVGIDYPDNWDDDKDEYWGDWVSIEITGITRFSNRDNFEVMQYTGLKDKNGKEIYEGDIVKRVDDGQMYLDTVGNIYEVIWGDAISKEPTCFTYKGLNKGMFKNTGYHYLNPISGVEVIGNIYEDPELIKNPHN